MNPLPVPRVESTTNAWTTAQEKCGVVLSRVWILSAASSCCIVAEYQDLKIGEIGAGDGILAMISHIRDGCIHSRMIHSDIRGPHQDTAAQRRKCYDRFLQERLFALQISFPS